MTRPGAQVVLRTTKRAHAVELSLCYGRDGIPYSVDDDGRSLECGELVAVSRPGRLLDPQRRVLREALAASRSCAHSDNDVVVVDRHVVRIGPDRAL